MNPIDLAFLAVLGYGIYKGVKEGFVGAVWSMIQIILAVIVALRFSYIAGSIFERILNMNEVFTPILAFTFVFLLALAFFFVIGQGFTMFLKATHISTLSQSIGILIWAALLTIGFSVALSFSDYANILSNQAKSDSKVYASVQPISGILFCKLDFVGPSASKIFQSVEQIAKLAAEKAIGECSTTTTVTTVKNDQQEQDDSSQ
ncbi:MAG: CvpA family protein [Sphingobacteriales bacterium]|nr:MAG: CvpA family protein [Sphingobacteriales bacterium]